MNVAGVAIMILVLVAVTLLFSYGLLRTYIDRLESNMLTSFVSTTAIAVTLLCVLLVPVDIYIVSSGLNHDGSQSDPALTSRSGDALQTVYYALYIALLAFAFLLLPFTYFYYEEDGEDSTRASRSWAALKYTAGFIVFFFVLLTLGLVLKKGKQHDTEDWRAKLSNDFSGAEAILSFCIGCLACIGLVAYVVYAAYGLARMPLKLMAKAKAREPTLPTSAPSPLDGSSRGEDLELALRKNQENLNYLQSQYDLSGRPWSKDDLKQFTELKREQRRLQQLRQAKQRTGQAVRSARMGREDVLTCWDKCWNFLVPVRMVIAIPLLLVSLLLITSVTLTVVDKFEHSLCGPSCGYSLAKTHIINPVDEAFRRLAKVFPIDCILFTLLVLYIFLACVSGMVGLGVRVFIVKLYAIQKGRTLPNAFLMAAWLLSLMTLVLNLQISVIAPSYSSFGNQFFLNTTSGERVVCDNDMIGRVEHTCIQTQLGKFMSTMQVETPFFAVILFYGNLAFLGFFALFIIHGVFFADNGKKEEVDAFRRLQDESDSD